MRNSILGAAALASAAVLSGCVTPVPDHVRLDSAARASIESTEVVAPIQQSEIYIFVPASQVARATGGGLIPALIDAGIDAHNAKTAAVSVKPLRDALVDYNFDQKLQGDLQSSLTQVSWLKVGGVRVTKDVTGASMSSAVTNSRQSAVLIVTGDYLLNKDATTVIVTLNADLFANSDALKKYKPAKTASDGPAAAAGNAIYRARLSRMANLPVLTSDRDANVAQWAADHGKLMRAALDTAVEQLTHELADDIQAPTPGGGAETTGK